MKVVYFLIATFATITSTITVVSCDIACQDPTSSKNTYVGESQECVALVKAKCNGLANIQASTKWKRGRNVQDNCKTIAKYTAVATFIAANDKYKGHAAIFVSCTEDGKGVYVWDQWKDQTVHLRIMQFGNTYGWPSNDASALYTVEL